MMRVLVIVLLIGGMDSLHGQSTTEESDSLSLFFRFDDASPLSCLFTYFPPFFIQHGIELKSFIRSKTFKNIRDRYGDVRAVDAIFIRAMQMTNNNTAISLFLATIACMDHRIIGVKIPIFALYLPLSNESEREYSRRVNNLPSQLYRDSSPGVSGDRDKLQHFFGSTFLTFAFESEQSAERIGDFVEAEEDAFIVEGVLDERDKRANRQGQQFGLALLEDNHRLPSEFFPAKRTTTKVSMYDESRCRGVW